MSLLGRGKFSVVHRTKRKADNLPVALKTIQVHPCEIAALWPLTYHRSSQLYRWSRPQVFEMASRERNECINEIQLLQQMQHPHIIRYLDCKMERNELTVVMELAGQGDLARFIAAAAKAGTQLGEVRAWEYFAQIADALAYMHERRVMHRDVKPANVFISTGGDGTTVMKLGDLGLGRYFSSKTDVTHSTVGTPYYMSPECIQGGGYEFRSDIWSLGCLLYELATLRSPFYSDGLNFYMLGKRIMARQFDPIGNVSAALVSCIDRMLQINPADRPSAAEAYALALASMQGGAGAG